MALSKLLCAGFRRYRKNVFVWLSLVWSVIDGLMYSTHYSTFTYGWGDDSRFMISLVIYAVCISVVISFGFGEGAYRNKLVCGHTKTRMYLAEYLLCIAFGLAMAILTLAAAVIPHLGELGEMELRYGLVFLFDILLSYLSMASIIFALSMMISNKIMMVVAAVAALVLCVLPNSMEAKVNQLEFLGEKYWMNGEFVWAEDAEPNPHYLKSPFREMAVFAYEATPFGQLERYNETFSSWKSMGSDLFAEYSNKSVYLKTIPLYSLCVIVLSFGTGLLLFGKRELK